MENKEIVIVYDGVLTTTSGGTQTISVRGVNMTIYEAAQQVVESLIGPDNVNEFREDNDPNEDLTNRIAEPTEDWTIFNVFETFYGYATLIVKRNVGEEIIFHKQMVFANGLGVTGYTFKEALHIREGLELLQAKTARELLLAIING